MQSKLACMPTIKQGTVTTMSANTRRQKKVWMLLKDYMWWN